ncbi:HAD-IA family hydrolase [Cyanobium sp. NIES-981]|uniref:HAD-IA family hydrolase n=1 Tax=Cyanobium sp. NIES-981 TaxID=1851505 RepID=UPI0007DCC74C|nr:HAD-IA family hydrolase [Cyanobium sp. NIES-981]SBO44761.1 Haloacid dehalogenase, IA family protein [Cyanobium sp. NIES-981]
MTAPPPGRRPQGLLLDAMGTLVGLRQSVGTTYAAQASQHGIHLDPAALDEGFRRAYRSAPPLAFPTLSGADLAAAELAWWSAVVCSSLESAGATEVPPGLCHALFDHFATAAPWRVYPEVPGLLERWHRRGLRLAVVSNFDSRLHSLLEELELAPWLDAVVVSSSAGAAKPDPAPFRQALQQLGLDAAAVWHVGDSPEDEAGAAAAGIPCVLIRRP